jgi:hypothetical protein
MTRFIRLAILLTLLTAGCACAEKLPDEPQALVDMLAGTGDESASEDAQAAHDRLAGMGTAAFPVLIENRDDERETWNCFQLQTTDPTTVGMVCACIIQGQVEVNVPKGYYDLCLLGFLPSKRELIKWWKERPDWTLKEMQIEAARHSLQKALEWQHFSSEEDRQKVIEMYQNRLKELGADKLNLRAALSVDSKVVQVKELERFCVYFELANEGNMPVDPRSDTWRLSINGRVHPDCVITFANGPRDSRWESLPPGDRLNFGYVLGDCFKKPGTYTLVWRGPHFESAPLVFEVVDQE